MNRICLYVSDADVSMYLREYGDYNDEDDDCDDFSTTVCVGCVCAACARREQLSAKRLGNFWLENIYISSNHNF